VGSGEASEVGSGVGSVEVWEAAWAKKQVGDVNEIKEK